MNEPPNLRYQLRAYEHTDACRLASVLCDILWYAPTGCDQVTRAAVNDRWATRYPRHVNAHTTGRGRVNRRVGRSLDLLRVAGIIAYADGTVTLLDRELLAMSAANLTIVEDAAGAAVPPGEWPRRPTVPDNLRAVQAQVEEGREFHAPAAVLLGHRWFTAAALARARHRTVHTGDASPRWADLPADEQATAITAAAGYLLAVDAALHPFPCRGVESAWWCPNHGGGCRCREDASPACLLHHPLSPHSGPTDPDATLKAHLHEAHHVDVLPDGRLNFFGEHTWEPQPPQGGEVFDVGLFHHDLHTRGTHDHTHPGPV